MEIKTDRLVIRYIREDDWKSIGDIWRDFSSSPFAQYDVPHDFDDENAKIRVAKWARANSAKKHMFFAVCLDDRVIGYIALNIRNGSYEVGYCFHSAFHGKGYAKESHKALFEYLKTIGIGKITAGTAINNTPSVLLLKALGFRQTGTEKVSFYKDKDGSDIVFDGGIYELTL